MAENPLSIFEKLDPRLLNLIKNNHELALSEGSLSKKNKLLIAMALDASLGASKGVKSLAQAALGAGATKEEIIEALRVAYYICGVSCVYAAAEAFRDLFEH